HKSIVLHGHSLGNIQVQYFAANNWEPEIKALVLTGMFGNLPWKSRHILVQMNWITGQKVPMTAQHFLTYRWENSSAADGTYWIRRVPYPILMVRDEG